VGTIISHRLLRTERGESCGAGGERQRSGAEGAGPRRRAEGVKASRGTAVEGAQLHIDLRTDVTNPHAQEILLESVHVEV